MECQQLLGAGSEGIDFFFEVLEGMGFVVILIWDG